MRNKFLLLLTALTLSFSVQTFAADKARPEIGPEVKAYSSHDSANVWVLRIGARADNQALVQITGIDHDLNGKIEKYQVEKTDKDTRYVTQINGQRYVLLRIGSGFGFGELYLPGEKKEIFVSYDKGLSSAGNPEHFLTDYLNQGGN